VAVRSSDAAEVDKLSGTTLVGRHGATDLPTVLATDGSERKLAVGGDGVGCDLGEATREDDGLLVIDDPSSGIVCSECCGVAMATSLRSRIAGSECCGVAMATSLMFCIVGSEYCGVAMATSLRGSGKTLFVEAVN